jgi:hypothetical protein
MGDSGLSGEEWRYGSLVEENGVDVSVRPWCQYYIDAEIKFN